MAISISKAENNTRQCNRISKVNSNGTKDYGLFQINEVHLKKGYTLDDFKDCTKNIQIAYEIFKASGWNAWSTFHNGTYKNYLTIN